MAGGPGPGVEQTVERAGPDGARGREPVGSGEGRCPALTRGADEAHRQSRGRLDARRQHGFVSSAGHRQGDSVFCEQALGQRASPILLYPLQAHVWPVHTAHRHVAAIGRGRACYRSVPGHRARLFARVFNCGQAAAGQSEQGRECQRRRPHDPEARPRAHHSSSSGESGESPEGSSSMSLSGSSLSADGAFRPPGGSSPGSDVDERPRFSSHFSTSARA